MSGLCKEIKYFWKSKCFAVGIPLMMLLSYGTLLLNPTIGIDDTSFKLYYIDGVSPAMGRWCLYLINKIFPLDYNPFFVEAMGLLFFCLSITLWCVVFHRMFGEQIPMSGYTIFGGVMLSSPIISEVVVWYVQDGIYLGYGVTALAVLLGMEAFREGTRESKRKRFGRLLLCAAMLTVALGFYEAFMIVFLMAMVMIFLLIRVLERKDYSSKPGEWLVNMLFTGVCAMVMRTVVVELVIVIFRLQDQTEVLRSRGLAEVLGWLDGTKSWDDFTFVMKDFLVKYCFNAAVYLPVLILMMAVALLVVWGVYRAIKHKDGWIAAAVAGILLLPWIMPVLEGVATYYRSSEYVPLLTAFTVLLAAWEIQRLQRSRVRYAGLFLAFVLLYNQGYEMNKWLYVDAMKYEDAKRTMDAVALEIMENYDASKPICVIGNYKTPASLTADAYCPSWSKKYWIVSTLVKALDEEIFEKYDFPEGYAAAETPRLSVIDWGATAFFHFDRELIKFWSMHGFTFTEDNNIEHYDEARELMEGKPAWPEAGSIVETDSYIIVNFG